MKENSLHFLILLSSIHLVLSQNEKNENNQEKRGCREKDKLISSEKENFYTLVDVLEGQTLVLQCGFCNSKKPNASPKNWYKIDQLGFSKAYEIKSDLNSDEKQNRIFIDSQYELSVKNITVEDIGFYYCVHNEDQSNDEKINYLVDIVDEAINDSVEKGNITEWATYYENYLKYANTLFRESATQEFVYIRNMLKIKMEVITNWEPWSTCQVCGRPNGNGIMKRNGVCRIKLNPNEKLPENLSADEIYLFNAPAISCRSKRFRRMFPRISDSISAIPDFILDQTCEATCNPELEKSNYGWIVGKSGSYKYRKHIVFEEGSHYVFLCPESTLENNVIWKKNGKVLKRGDFSNPHVYTDLFNTLYLAEVTPMDAGNYTCLVDNVMMQQIMVFVYSKSKFLTSELLRYMIYLGYILFLSSFCYCAGLAISCTKRHTFKTYNDIKTKKQFQTEQDEELENLI